jgi:hypothetical protein
MKLALLLPALALVACGAAQPDSSGRVILYVTDHLVDPDSAKFRNVFSPAGTAVWCGEVNARNRMGGMTGFSRFVVLLDPRSKGGTEGATLYIERGGLPDADIEGKWQAYCT